MCKTFYLFGTTCVGKDYFTDTATTKYPHLFGSVNVGKEFRRRYPPEYFEGKGAMEKTEDEAFAIFKEQWDLNKMIGKKYILVSGQPRLPSQVERILGYAPGTVIFMFAPDDVLFERLKKRFPDNPSATELSLKRLANDRIQLYEVLFTLIEARIPITTLDTRYRPTHEVVDQIAHFGDF